MEMRTYKNTDEKISLLGFGCMRLPLVGDTQKIDTAMAQEMVDYAIKNGVNYFDTAYVYHEAMSEFFIGEALSKYPRSTFNLATKMPTWLISSEEDVHRIFDEQLKKCRVEYFDYYLIHNLQEESFKNAEKHNIYHLLREKQREGKIRRLGFSFHDRPSLLKEIVNKHEWDFVQIQLNYMDWELQDASRLYEILVEKGIPVIVMEPVRGGALNTLCPESVELLKKAAPDASIASWAIRYAASLHGVLTVLSGMSNLEQVRDNIKTMSDFHPLSQDDYDTINTALAKFRLSGKIPCTACRYCMDCPSGVDIPKVFAIYNRYHHCGTGPDERFLFDFEYQVLGKDKQAENCINCGVCVSNCPQAIDIPQWMHQVGEFVAMSEGNRE